MSKKRTLKIILWSARILGALVIIFLLMMTIGELFTDSNITAISTSDAIALLLFPGTIILGLLLAFKWKGLGGLITVGGMICLHIIRPDLASSVLISAFAIPGLLYIIYSVWSKN
ncbi:hypothetical protein E5167_05240 [Pontimicrobium aquaticum]|uniref:DUF7670 domain-containing protein n=1 Tax=Pontimicrobium aquaticum TaxID=2565367 RepID=A0A4U0F3N4_9FLAO|nr:hypothetical protein E5167_05240 [Pontimicrobium aquaticum]